MARNIDQMNKVSEDFEYNPKLSIIVPVYRVENYLKRCIESILNQSFQNFELILVDDGSPDRCGEIIDQFHQIDKRVVAIHQTNQGVSAARNAGLQIAKSKYIGFVDPDDWIEPEMYEIMIRAMETDNSDVACCNWNDICADGTISRNIISGVEAIMDHEKFINHIFDMPYTILGSVCNKLFKRNLIDFNFPIGCKMGEDTIFTIMYARITKRATYINKELYNVFLRPDSAMRSKKENMAEGILAWEKVLELVQKESRKTRYLAERMYLDKCLLFSKRDGDLGRIAGRKFGEYIKDHTLSVLCNPEIYWKTRLVYLCNWKKMH